VGPSSAINAGTPNSIDNTVTLSRRIWWHSLQGILHIWAGITSGCLLTTRIPRWTDSVRLVLLLLANGACASAFGQDKRDTITWQRLECLTNFSLSGHKSAFSVAVSSIIVFHSASITRIQPISAFSVLLLHLRAHPSNSSETRLVRDTSKPITSSHLKSCVATLL
jgi:hypothetical protein